MTREQSELLLEQIKANYNQATIIEILKNLGYEFNRAKKFKLRAEEKTASASVSKSGLINDFGGEGYDILKILVQERAMSFPEAMRFVADQMNITYSNDDYQPDPIEVERRKIEMSRLRMERLERAKQEARDEYQLKLQAQEQARKTIAWYDSYRDELQTFRNPDYYKEALAIAPMWVYQQATPDAINHFKYLTSFDVKIKTIIAKIFDYNNTLISYKRRRYTLPDNTEPSKWVTKSKTAPNKQCYISIPNAGPVYIVEGHHDLLTASLMQRDDYDPFNFIMIPTENYQKFNEIELKALEGREINFIVDIKKDNIQDSLRPMLRLSSSLKKEQANEAVLINLFEFLDKNEISTDTVNKLDLSNAIELWDNDLTAFKGSLEYYADTVRLKSELF